MTGFSVSSETLTGPRTHLTLASENKFSILATMCTPAYYETLGAEVSRYFDAEG